MFQFGAFIWQWRPLWSRWAGAGHKAGGGSLAGGRLPTQQGTARGSSRSILHDLSGKVESGHPGSIENTAGPGVLGALTRVGVVGGASLP